MSTGQTVLVTGASGHVGSEVIARLTKRGHSVIALAHSQNEIIANNGQRLTPVRLVTGDVRRPDLGLDAPVVSELADHVALVVHCAALTDFGLPENRYAELNVAGTANALALARRWDADFLYVSTAYVCGALNGTFYEDQLDIGQQFGTPYEHSKYQAEQLVHASDLRWAVVRPGIVSGEHRTGNSRIHRHIYQVLKLIVEGKLKTLPGNYSATLGLAPIGHVADTIVAAVEKFSDNVGYTFHAVGSSCLSLQSISDTLAEYPSFQVADFVPPSTFSPDDLDEIERGYFQKLGTLYTSYLTRRLEFDSANTRDRLGIAPPATGAGYFRRVLDSCLRTGYLGNAEPSIAEVLARLQLKGSHV